MKNIILGQAIALGNMMSLNFQRFEYLNIYGREIII
jgi:hypothetical protein